jgi:hypothetical protein
VRVSFFLRYKSNLADDDLTFQRETNASAPIYSSVRGRLVDSKDSSLGLRAILGLDAYSAGSEPFKPSSLNTLLSSLSANTRSSAGAISHSHVDSITTLVIPLPVVPFATRGPFDEQLRELLWPEDRSSPSKEEEGMPTTLDDSERGRVRVLRCKGLIKTADGKFYVLQAVRELYEVKELVIPDQNKPAGTAVTETEPKLVLIGTGLHEGIRDDFIAGIRKKMQQSPS